MIEMFRNFKAFAGVKDLPFRKITWLKIFLVAAFFFFLNQVIEFNVLFTLSHHYEELCKLDCGWYESIAVKGYDKQPHFGIGHPKMDAANWAFFPMFPLLSKIIINLFGFSPSLSLVLTSKFFFLLSIIAFIKMGLELFPKMPMLFLGSVVALNPYSFYGNVGYSESLYLFGSSVFFIFLKRNSYVYSGIVGGFLSSVRFVGVLVVFSLLYNPIKRFLQERALPTEREITGIFLSTFGLVFFMIFLHSLSGDALGFSHIQIAWGRSLSNPLRVILGGFRSSSLNKYWAFLTVISLFVAPFYLYLKKIPRLALFGFLSTFIPVSTGLGSMPRFVFWSPPFLIFLSCVLAMHRVWLLLIPIFLFGLVWNYHMWFSNLVFMLA